MIAVVQTAQELSALERVNRVVNHFGDRRVSTLGKQQEPLATWSTDADGRGVIGRQRRSADEMWIINPNVELGRVADQLGMSS